MSALPSVATFRWIQSNVSWASSQLRLNNSKLLNSVPTAPPPCVTLLNLGPITPEPPEAEGSGVPDVTGGTRLVLVF